MAMAIMVARVIISLSSNGAMPHVLEKRGLRKFVAGSIGVIPGPAKHFHGTVAMLFRRIDGRSHRYRIDGG
jgi:hypothetical protein